MKKLTILFTTLFLLIIPIVIKGDVNTSAPYKTYTTGPSNKLIETQTAYEPAGNIKLNLRNPEDIYLKDEIIYIADTGNKEIIKYDLNLNIRTVFKTGFNEPTGVHVDENDQVYVADKGAKSIFIYDKEGNLIKQIERPKEPIFGNAPFVPLKVVTGPRGVIYVVGDGSTGGLIQLNQSGEFQGFFGANDTKMTLMQRLAKLFNVKSSKNIPVSPLNVAIDDKGSLYTVSLTEDKKLKKFNIASETILTLHEEENFNALLINDFNNIYALTTEGVIYEYDSFGQLIFKFGGKDTGTRRLGLFVNPVALALDKDNNIYVLDKGLSEIQILQKSEFTALIHEGLEAFKDGIYDLEKWDEVLRMNGMFGLANSAIARAEFRNHNYDNSLSYYKIANDKAGYSEAFWQLRYNFLQANMLIIIIVVIGLVVGFKALKFADGKWQIYAPLRKGKAKLNKFKLVRELKLILNIFRHPLDTFYEIKKEKKSSYLAATIIYISFIVVMIFSDYVTAFLFNNNDLQNYNLLRTFLLLAGLLILFVGANYLVSSLQSGEGFFKDIYLSTAYALAPIIVFTPFLVLLTHGLTYNESFIYSSLQSITIAWSLILVIVMLKEVHNYTIKELIINILLTLFAMVMIVVILALLYLLTNQLYEYVIGILKEVFVYARV